MQPRRIALSSFVASTISLVACAPPRAAEAPPPVSSVLVPAPAQTPAEAAPPLSAVLRAPEASEAPKPEVAPLVIVSATAARCPAEMALVGGFVCIDRWEDSLVALEGGNDHELSPFEPVDHVEHYRAVSRGGVVPHGYISGKQAEIACHASGKRLCSAAEWERGCRGPEGLRFPYGNERRAHVCNDDVRKTHPVAEAAARMHIPKEDMWSKGMNLAIINQLPDTLLPTGDRSECVTPEGLYDMVGNLHEWVADATFRGGYYMDTAQNGDGCSYRTSAHAFGYHDYSTGFRCCTDPDPIE